MTLTCLVKKQMAGSTLNKGVFGHFLFLVNYSGHSFMASAKPGEIFNAIHNQKTIPDQDHFIFCNVVFGHGRRTYSYLADQDDYAPGGQVIVPVGADNREAVATIRSIKMYSKEDVPYPIKKMKHILRKYREEDEDA